MDGYSVMVPGDAVPDLDSAVAMVRQAMIASGRPDGDVLWAGVEGDDYEVVITVNPLPKPSLPWHDPSSMTKWVADTNGLVYFG